MSSNVRCKIIVCNLDTTKGHEKALVSGSQSRDDSIRVSNIYIALGLAI
jgi:hypothetical protein